MISAPQLENLSEDMGALLKVFFSSEKSNAEITEQAPTQNQSRKSKQSLIEAYKNVLRDIIQRLKVIFADDFHLFDYDWPFD